MKDLKNKVIVITGASSGIGRATALLAAEQGASVVLVSRQEKALRAVARECEETGSDRALVKAADVTDADAVWKLAKDAYFKFGHIDAWVNNAAVTLFARFEEASAERYRRVIETNFYGYINGARAVFPYFREQGGGTLINVSSMVGKVGSPYVSAYTTSKFAINGWTESLRMELQDVPQIQICTVLAASIDTPLFQHAANYTGRAVKPLPPVYSPEQVAKAIVGCIEKPRREVYVGPAGAVMAKSRTLAPALAEKMVAKQVEKEHFQDRFEEPTEGNLYKPMPGFNSVTGGWREREASGGKRGAIAGAAAVAAGLGAVGYLLNRNKNQVKTAGRRVAERSRQTALRAREQGEKLMRRTGR